MKMKTKKMTETSPCDAGTGGQALQRKIRVWDPLIRGFHWGLVVAFSVAFVSAEQSGAVHEISGYVVAGLVAIRLIWGFLGSRYARFTQFLKGPKATVRYLRDMVRGHERRYLGHNPAGAAMIVALLISLSGTAYTGWLMRDQTGLTSSLELPQIVTPAFADEDDEARLRGVGRDKGAGVVAEAHETLANLTLLLIAGHLAGVALASFRHRENLARAMVVGDKRGPEPDDIA